MAESDHAVVVAFAGTDPVVAANWLTDFDIRTAPGGVHRGDDDPEYVHQARVALRRMRSTLVRRLSGPVPPRRTAVTPRACP